MGVLLQVLYGVLFLALWGGPFVYLLLTLDNTDHKIVYYLTPIIYLLAWLVQLPAGVYDEGYMVPITWLPFFAVLPVFGLRLLKSKVVRRWLLIVAFVPVTICSIVLFFQTLFFVVALFGDKI